MTLETFLFLLNVAVDVHIVIFVDVLSQKVEAVQLVEDLDCCAVAFLACLWVFDLERVLWEAEAEQFFLRDHLVAHVVGDGVPCLVNLGTVADEGTLHQRREIITDSVVFHDRGHRCCYGQCCGSMITQEVKEWTYTMMSTVL